MANESISPDVMVILDLITALKQVIPDEIRPNLRLSKAFMSMQKEHIEERLEEYKRIMAEQRIDEKLISIAAIPFKRFNETKDNLYWVIIPG